MKEIIQKNGKYWKECDIVMLSTSRENNPIIAAPDNKTFMSLYQESDKKYEGMKPQHLYILSNEQINEGDWIGYPNLKNWVPVQYLKGDLTGLEKKIIASTDSSLTVEMIGSQVLNRNKSCEDYGFKSGVGLLSHVRVESLPKLPEDFIKKYVESNGSIKQVLVEYEEKVEFSPTWEQDYIKYGLECPKYYNLKLNPDNTLNILIEDSVEEAAKQYLKEVLHTNGSRIDAFLAGAEWQKNQLNN